MRVESSMDDVEEDNDAAQGVNKKRSLTKKKKVVATAAVVDVDAKVDDEICLSVVSL